MTDERASRRQALEHEITQTLTAQVWIAVFMVSENLALF